MKRRKTIVVVVLLLCMISCQTKEKTLPTVPKQETIKKEDFGPLSVNGTKLMANENVVQLKGISTHGLSWFPEYVNYEAMKQMKEWGCNVFRLAMYTDEYQGYCVSDETQKQFLKQKIDEAVTFAKELELYIIVDWHILRDANPLIYKEEAKIFFQEMAKTYAQEEHIIYEICNEPNGDTTWVDIKQYANEIIPSIREYDTQAVILVGTPTWSQDIDLVAIDPLEGYDNIMYTLHFYADTHKEELRQRMVIALQKGVPVFVSEFGICDASGNGTVNTLEADVWLQVLDTYDISYVMWNLSNKEESSSIIKSNVQKVSNFTKEELTPTGIWFLEMLNNDNSIDIEKKEMPILTMEEQNQWQQDGYTYYQYTITVENRTVQSYLDWYILIETNQSSKIQEYWNIEIKEENNQWLLSPPQYHNVLEAGDTLADIGLIIQAKEGLQITGKIGN